MKKYVFVTWGISGVGGGQFYIRNICRFYNDKGWGVYVIHEQDGSIIIKGFENIPHSYIREIGTPIGFYSRKKVKDIVNAMSSFISYEDGDEVVVESTSVSQAQWAEAFAQRVGGKHIYYILAEGDHIYHEGLCDFVRFKKSRDELAGIHPNSVSNLFRGYEEVTESKQYWILAHSAEGTESYSVPILEHLQKADYAIGLMGRLEKPFVYPSLTSIFRFCDDHKDLKVNLIVVGDTPFKDVKKRIVDLFSHSSNCNLVLTGFLNPVPQRYVDICDVCIGSAGCVGLTHRAGRVTISIDAQDNMPIGVFGHTTQSTMFRGNEPKIPLEVLLSDILIEKKYPREHGIIPRAHDNDYYNNLHYQWAQNTSQTIAYYDVFSIFPPLYRYRKYKIVIHNLVKSVLGKRMTQYVKQIIRH